MPRQSLSRAMSNDIKQEDIKQEIKSEPGLPSIHRRPRPASYPRYDYDSAISAAKEKMYAEGISELPPSEVGRVIENGDLVALHDINPFGKTQFVAFDGYDFVARIQNGSLIGTLMYELASLHFGKKAQSTHPDDLIIVTKIDEMKDLDGKSGGWVISIRPEVTPGKRKSGNGQQTNGQRKRTHY